MTITAAPTTEPEAATPDPSPRRRLSPLGAWPYAAAGLIAFAVALWTYRPWLFDGAVMAPEGDSLAFHAWIQNIVETGWYETGERLAAPFVSNGHSYPVTDELTLFAVGKVLAPLTGGVAPAVLWWVILGFPLAAVVGVAAARYLGVGRLAAVVPGVAFALLPDHFLRATGHFSLTSIWAMGLGVLAALTLLGREAMPARRRVALEIGMIAACVVVSLTNIYYAVFTGVLVTVAGIGGAVAQRSWWVLARAVARGTAIVVPVAIALYMDIVNLPTPLGFESVELTRGQTDAELYGGKITAMLLPAMTHRFAAFREARLGYDATFPNPAESPALGIVASVGFLGLLAWSVIRLWNRRRRSETDHTLGILAGLTWVCVLMFVVGGLGTVWAILLGGGGVRAWSRMHIAIALLALLVVGVVLSRVSRPLIRALVVLAVLGLVLIDQTSPWQRPDAARSAAVAAEMERFTSDVAEITARSAMIYQLPQVTFPLPQILTAPASGYDGFLPYLYSRDLHWSYGGYLGDPTTDWQDEMSQLPVAEQVPLLDAAGFAGIVLDTAADTTLPALAADIEATLGAPDLVSDSGRWEFYSITGACGSGRGGVPADLAVQPPLLYAGDGFAGDGQGGFSTQQPTTSLDVITLRDAGWDDVDIAFELDTPATYRVTFPDGLTREVGPGAEAVQWNGFVPGGESSLRMERVGGVGGVIVRALTISTDTPRIVGQCLGQ